MNPRLLTVYAALLGGCHLLFPFAPSGTAADRTQDQRSAGGRRVIDATDEPRGDLAPADAERADGALDDSAAWDGRPLDAARDARPLDAVRFDAAADAPSPDGPPIDALPDVGAADLARWDAPRPGDGPQSTKCTVWSDWTLVTCSTNACRYTCMAPGGTTYALQCNVEVNVHPAKALCDCRVNGGALEPCGPATTKITPCDLPCADAFAGGCCRPPLAQPLP